MSIKKIGILTFHRAINYGAVLQAFALQEFISEKIKNSEVSVINFYTELQDTSYFQYSRLNWGLRKILIYLVFQSRRAQKRKYKFDSFITKYLHLTERYADEKKFLVSPPSFDIYITGSDQVFNPKNIYRDVYYLNFSKSVDCRKVAYAASLGVSSYAEEDRSTIQRYLSDFDSISCREKHGVDAIEQLGFKSSHVLDPVFLLNATEWKNKIKFNFLKNKLPSKYIFVYDLNGGTNLINKAKELSKITGLPIVCLTYNILQRYRLKYIFYNWGPEEFLYYLSNADYVVTDSFHGTAFSIVFRRSFFTYIALEKNSSRIYSLLDSLLLSDRIVFSETVFNSRHIDIVYSMNIVNQLDYLKLESEKYILESLK